MRLRHCEEGTDEAIYAFVIQSHKKKLIVMLDTVRASPFQAINALDPSPGSGAGAKDRKGFALLYGSG